MLADPGFVRVWRFRARPGAESRFEELYGSEGAWAQLFARHPGFRGTTLERVHDAVAEYLVIDLWESRLAWLNFRRDHAAEYQELDRECETLTLSEELIRECESGAL